MSNKLSQIANVLFASVMSLGAVGCAGNQAASSDAYDDVEDDRADSVGSVPLRNRGTWAKRLTACRTAYDAALDSKEAEELDTIAPIIDDYTTCLEAANNRTLARIGRQLDANLANRGAYFTLADAQRLFATTRDALDSYCSDITGLSEPIDSVTAEDYVVKRVNFSYCRLDGETALTQQIGTYVAFDDVGDFNTYDISFLQDANRQAPTAIEAPVCKAAYDAALQEPLSQREIESTTYAFMSCVENGAFAALPDAIAAIAPSLTDPDAIIAYQQRIRTAYEGYLELVNERCGVLTQAGSEGGGSLADTFGSECALAETLRAAKYIDELSPIAYDFAADPDSNGIPGDQSDEDGAGEGN